MTNIQNGGYLCESADDVKYWNDVKHKKKKKKKKWKLVSCVHEKIANRMKLECRDGPKEDRYKSKINVVNRNFCFDNVNKYTMETRSKTNVFEWYHL